MKFPFWMTFRVVLCLSWGLLLVCDGWSAQVTAQDLSSLNLVNIQDERVQIEKLLKSQAEAWNQGDFEQFMKTYWRSPALTFSAGGTTTRGWDETLKRYRQSYAPPKEMGSLKFSDVEITILETKTALVLGNWQLTMKDQSKRSGNYSLMMHKIDDQWRIIHDHSSELESVADPASPPDSDPDSIPGSGE